MYFIYLELGFSMFTGVVVMLILTPVSTLATKFGGGLEKTHLEYKDERLKVQFIILV